MSDRHIYIPTVDRFSFSCSFYIYNSSALSAQQSRLGGISYWFNSLGKGNDGAQKQDDGAI